jgi:hypothetical protein
MRSTLLAWLVVSSVGCSDGVAGVSQPGLQYEGSIISSPTRTPELSAPLFPDSRVFQRFQDPTVYPTLTEGTFVIP